MAPMKRARVAADDGDMEIVEVESAQSHLRQDTVCAVEYRVCLYVLLTPS